MIKKYDRNNLEIILISLNNLLNNQCLKDYQENIRLFLNKSNEAKIIETLKFKFENKNSYMSICNYKIYDMILMNYNDLKIK